MNRGVVFRACMMKTFIELRRYMFNTISFMLTMYIGFLILFFGAQSLGAGVSWAGEGLEALVVGYLVWTLSLSAYQDLAWTVHNEAQIGTLEQLYLAPAGFALVSAGIMTARLLYNLMLSALLLAAMMLTSGYRLNLDLISLVPLILMVIAAPYGFGFAMGGLALVFKRIQSSFQILQFLFLAFIAIPLDVYPAARFLPLTLGSKLIRQVMVRGDRLWALPPAELVTATAVSLGYFVLGLLVFRYCLERARDAGLMGQY